MRKDDHGGAAKKEKCPGRFGTTPGSDLKLVQKSRFASYVIEVILDLIDLSLNLLAFLRIHDSIQFHPQLFQVSVAVIRNHVKALP